MQASIDPEWVEEALEATGTATLLPNRRDRGPLSRALGDGARLRRSEDEMLERQESIRSRSPAGVGQELWGVALAYNLVRLEMLRIAEEANVAPTRISFVMALRLIRDEWLWCAVAKPGAIPRHLRELRAEVLRFVLPPRRPERSYPRVVKNKFSLYPAKRRSPK